MMVDVLMKYEIIDFDQIDDIMVGCVLCELCDWQGGLGIGILLVNLEELGCCENIFFIGGLVGEY